MKSPQQGAPKGDDIRHRRINDLLEKLRENLLSPVAAAVAGQPVLVRTEVGGLFAIAGPCPQRPVLTGKQHDVLQMIGLDLGNAGIAERLGLSEDAIDYHISHLLAKFGVSGRTALVRKAALCGFLPLGGSPECP